MLIAAAICGGSEIRTSAHAPTDASDFCGFYCLHANAGRKIDAIKRVRDLKRVSLEAAKDYGRKLSGDFNDRRTIR